MCSCKWPRRMIPGYFPTLRYYQRCVMHSLLLRTSGLLASITLGILTQGFKMWGSLRNIIHQPWMKYRKTQLDKPVSFVRNVRLLVWLQQVQSEQPLHTKGRGGGSYFCLIFKSACFIFSSILLQLNIIHFQLKFTYFWSSSQPLVFKPSSSTRSYSLQTSDLQHLHTLAKGDRPMQAHDLYFFANCEKISYIFLCATRSLIFANCGAKYHIW